MHLLRTALAVLAGLLVLQAETSAQPRATAVPVHRQDHPWKKEAINRGFDQKDVDRLVANKILVTNQTYRQVFTPYIESDLPVFITSDSVLNGFHVLLEESVLRLERANARRLPEILRFIWQNLETIEKDLQGKPELVAAAKRRAQVVIGTAMTLLDERSVPADNTTAPLIKEEVKRIIAAEARLKPAWLGPPDPGFDALDYSRYRPRGFYTKTDALRRYFRAVSWLQSIPFRVGNDQELLSILMLGNCITFNRFSDDFVKWQEYSSFFRCLKEFVGAGDDWDLVTAARQAQRTSSFDPARGGIAKRREWLLKRAAGHGEGPAISDQIAFAPDDPSKTAEVSFRVISAYRTPDAVLFQRTTDLRKLQRGWPSGLEVCAALGSSFARSRLADEEQGNVLATIDECQVFFSGSSLYFGYLDCLRSLLDGPEPDAPAFMSNEAWQIKSCQTALAGWAQLRHTWALQAKQNAHYLGLTEKPPGFVEPDPEFFARLAELVEETEWLLKQAGAFEFDYKAAVADIRDVTRLLKQKQVTKKGREALKNLSEEEMMTLGRIEGLMVGLRITPNHDDPAGFFRELIEKLDQLADRLETGKKLEEASLAKAVRETNMDIGALWRGLGTLCRRLEALAHKQLRGVPFSERENQFLIGYGEQLAGVMLYAGNSYLTPRDDAPRVVDVFRNPNVRKHLEVGIARPRALYVLYPFKDREVLCRGAVLPYYEFRHGERLTDADWQSLLDSSERPEIPAWVKPVVAGDGLAVPAPEDDE